MNARDDQFFACREADNVPYRVDRALRRLRKIGLAFHQYSAAEQKEFLPIVFCYSSKMHVPLSRSFCAAFLAISSFSGAQDTKPADIEARVYVYRYEQLYGKAIRPSLYCDEKEIARLQDGRYVALALKSGKHEFRSNDAQSRIDLDLKPGEHYYIRLDLATGLLKAHGRLMLMLPEQGQAEFKRLKPIDKSMVKDRTLFAADFVPE